MINLLSLLPYLILLVGVIHLLSIYKRISRLQQANSRIKQRINSLIRQRQHLIPKFISLCRESMQYEKAIFDRIIAARNRIMDAQELDSIIALGTAESLLRSSVGELLSLVSNYPELYDQIIFTEQLQTLLELDEAIVESRENYNRVAKHLNQRLKTFPNGLVGRLSGIDPLQLLYFKTYHVPHHYSLEKAA